VWTVHIANERSIALLYKQGYEDLGIVSNIRYVMLPMTRTGRMLFPIIKAGFPLIRLIRRDKHKRTS
jgi:RimJ/RimL family protein N-acetyltransferase